jgi:hypothetical protein
MLLLKIDSYQTGLLNNLISQNSDADKKETMAHTNGEKEKPTKIAETEKKDYLKLTNYMGKNFTIQVYEGNLLEEEVNVIVNAANIRLQLGGNYKKKT